MDFFFVDYDCGLIKLIVKRIEQLLENNILDGKVSRLVITHKGRLLRFGAELAFAICEAKQVEVVILSCED